MRKVLIITGDGGEAYEALYAVHRLREEGYTPVVAAPSRRRMHLVVHDFEPGWDTYIERPGYGMSSDIAISEANASDYDALLLMGGRAPETGPVRGLPLGLPTPAEPVSIPHVHPISHPKLRFIFQHRD